MSKYYNWSFYIFGTSDALQWFRSFEGYEYIHVVEQHGAIVGGRKYPVVMLGVIQFQVPRSFRDVTSLWKTQIKWHYYRSDKRMFFRATSLQRGRIFYRTVYESGSLIYSRWPKIKRWFQMKNN